MSLITKVHGNVEHATNNTHARYAREFLLRHQDEWTTLTNKRIIEDTFYDFVHRASKPTGYMSFEVMAYPEYGSSKDHWFNPRILCRAIMDTNLPMLYNEQQFIEIFYTSATTVRVTKPQNQELKRSVNKQLTVEKYDKYGWYFNNYGVAAEPGKGFPLKHVVPVFYTTYEQTLLTV